MRRTSASLFESIFKKDLYSFKIYKEQDFSWLEDAMDVCTAKYNKTVPPIWQENLTQIYDTCNLRFGVIPVRPHNSGKSYIFETLKMSNNWVMDHKFKASLELEHKNPLISECQYTK